ncbi:MAG: MipA/OmpV family protein [Pseudomonadota bacterium]
MKYVTAITLGFSLIVPSAVLAQRLDDDDQAGLRFTVSAGVISAPTFLGDDEQQTSVVPNITLSYGDRFTAGLDGVRYTVFSRGGFNAGIVGAYHFGRDENPDDNPFVVSGGDTTDLVGLGDIDGTFELGGFVEYEAEQFSARLELRQGIDGGHDGLYGEAEVMYNGSFNAFERPVFFSVGPAIAFGDDAYNSTFFDVSAAQSAASGISQFDAGGGLISYGLHATAVVPLSERTSLVGFVNYDQLTGDVGDSSIVQERGSENQSTVGMFLDYTF